jgi:sulfide:quinone oxidoreductase
MMLTSRTVLVLGGGVGGVVAATRLRARLPRRDRVVLIDREQHHLFQPSLLWLALGQRKPEQIQRPLERLRRRGIEVVTGEVVTFDPRAKRVRVTGTDLTGDAVIVSLGADLDPDVIPGLAAAGHNLYTLAGASAIHRALEDFRGGRVVVLTAAPAYKCPAAPYEAAMLLKDHLRRRKGGTATVEIFAAEAGPMGTAGPEVSAAVRGMVEVREIGYHPDHQIEAVDPATRKLHFKRGSPADYDLLIYVPPHRVPAVVRQAGLVGASGWVPVDAHSLRTEVSGVFAIGDVTGIPIPSGKALPKAGVFADRAAEVVAENLAAEWAGRIPERAFDGVGACFIEAGAGRAGYGSGDFYAAPAPRMQLHTPSRFWHLGKVLFEKRWLRKWF